MRARAALSSLIFRDLLNDIVAIVLAVLRFYNYGSTLYNLRHIARKCHWVRRASICDASYLPGEGSVLPPSPSRSPSSGSTLILCPGRPIRRGWRGIAADETAVTQRVPALSPDPPRNRLYGVVNVPSWSPGILGARRVQIVVRHGGVRRIWIGKR
jgi:hypothetical protein